LQFLEKHPELVEFGGGDGKGAILGFGAGAGDNRLFLGLPRNEAGAQEDAIAPRGLAVRGIPSPIRVTVGMKAKGTLGE
jgi:hypothetical protein